MSEQYESILKLFTNILVQKGIYTVDGIRNAYKDFCDSLAVQEYKSKPTPAANNDKYVQTTLAEAIQRAKQPVKIPVKKNEYDNFESTVYQGLIFKEFMHDVADPATGKFETYYVCVGFQDGKNIAPLSMNHLRICQANGWRFDVNNTIGCAKTTTSDLGIKL